MQSVFKRRRFRDAAVNAATWIGRAPAGDEETRTSRTFRSAGAKPPSVAADDADSSFFFESGQAPRALNAVRPAAVVDDQTQTRPNLHSRRHGWQYKSAFAHADAMARAAGVKRGW
jgi:hypothetical protein